MMLKDTIERIINNEDTSIPATIENRAGLKEVHVIKTPIPQIRDEVIRIVNEGDPIGFLIDVMNGALVESHIVNVEKELNSIKTTATVSERISIAKFLANKYMPTVAVTKHVVSNNPDAPVDGQRNLRQILNVAASKRA